ncbi:MAG: hypothetical protein QM479_17225, partial [Pseudomonadota bacterium]
YLKNYTYKHFKEGSCPQGNEPKTLRGIFEIPEEYHDSFKYLVGDDKLKITSLQVSSETPDAALRVKDDTYYYRFYLKDSIYISNKHLIQDGKSPTPKNPEIKPDTNTGENHSRDIELIIDEETNKIKIIVAGKVRKDLTNMGDLCGKIKDMETLLRLLTNGDISKREYIGEFKTKELGKFLQRVNSKLRKVLNVSEQSKPLQQSNGGIVSNITIATIQHADAWSETSTGLHEEQQPYKKMIMSIDSDE